MKTDNESGNDRASWRLLLRDALLTPGVMHEAYSRFHRYSLRNQLLALYQCAERKISPGPLATFKQWQSLGRFVIRGQKALTLCVPVTTKHRDEASKDAMVEEEPTARTFFVYRRRWFVLAQTDGEPYQPVELPAWSEERALQELGIHHVPFDEANGNVQGYSVERNIAINPVAALPHKTLYHELGHIVLGHTKDECDLPRHLRELEAESVALLCIEALGLPGASFARGYIQAWATSEDLTDEVASRIMSAADAILQAGYEPPSS